MNYFELAQDLVRTESQTRIIEEQIAKDLHLRQTAEQVSKMALSEKQTMEDVEAGRLAGGDEDGEC